MSRRTERVGEMLREEVSTLLQRQLKDPRLGFVTITGADVSPDLRHAKVFVSVLGTTEERTKSLEALGHARGFLRSELSKRARLRTVPELTFLEDEAAETGSRIFALLQEARQSDELQSDESDEDDEMDADDDVSDDEAVAGEDRQANDGR